MTVIDQASPTRISIPYQPFNFDGRGHAVEKAVEGGPKRRYLKGIISGPKIDGQGERITEKCIKSFSDQANSGDILLYADRHGVAYTDDIGTLTNHEISPSGDWVGEFRLYDEADGVGAVTLETADKLWRQVNGISPYKIPRQKGFSIEGYIPDDGIIYMSQDGKRVIDQVVLDGAVCVPRPAYTASVAGAIYKALGETLPQTQAKIMTSFAAVISDGEIQNAYYRKRYQYQDALESVIEDIMTHPGIRNKKNELERIFDEYGQAMIDLIISSQTIFAKNGDISTTEDVRYLYSDQAREKVAVLKSLLSVTDGLISKMQGELK